MQRVLIRILQILGWSGFLIFAIGMGNDKPTPLPFTADPIVNEWTFWKSAWVGFLGVGSALGMTLFSVRVSETKHEKE